MAPRATKVGPTSGGFRRRAGGAATRSWAPSGGAAWARSTPPTTRSWTGGSRSRSCTSPAPAAAERAGRACCARRGDRAPVAPERRHGPRRGTSATRLHRDGVRRGRDLRRLAARAAAHVARDPGCLHRGRARAGGGARGRHRPPGLQAWRTCCSARDGAVRVMDFGLARARGGAEPIAGTPRTRIERGRRRRP